MPKNVNNKKIVKGIKKEQKKDKRKVRKITKIRKILMAFLVLMMIILSYALFFLFLNEKEKIKKEMVKEELRKDIPEIIPDEFKKMIFDVKENEVSVFQEVVYDGLTYQELVDKLNRSLNSNLSNMGEVYARKSLELGIDPYLVVAISLHETGCKWNCSGLVRDCNNVGGIKGSPGCYGGSFKKYNSLEEGIESFITLIYEGYYGKGLTTPELMEYKYAGGSTTWAGKVNNYIYAIKQK